MDEVIDDLVSQYAEDTAFLSLRRNAATHAADYQLSDVAELDERLAAHIEGLHVSGIDGWRHCEKALERQGPGEAFAAAVVALETTDSRRIETVLNAVEPAPQMITGAASAFGWVAPPALKSTVSRLLKSQSPVRRRIALSACAMHRVDPGLTSGRLLEDPSPLVRARAIRTAGELGQVDVLPASLSALADKDPECHFWASWSSVILGDRDAALEVLSRPSKDEGPNGVRGFRLALQAMRMAAAYGWLKSLAADPEKIRLVIQGSGIAGDATFVPWLIGHMRLESTARLAGEAFTLITGVDLQKGGLEAKRPEGFESGPNDNPEDPNVDMDPDEGPLWPDPVKVEAWWQSNGVKFQKGQRHFMGAAVTREHCINVLKNGYQRQRILAAHYLCLLEPGTPLFNTSAPAWRQQRLLAKMA